jgi:hypothetical protein
MCFPYWLGSFSRAGGGEWLPSSVLTGYEILCTRHGGGMLFSGCDTGRGDRNSYSAGLLIGTSRRGTCPFTLTNSPSIDPAESREREEGSRVRNTATETEFLCVFLSIILTSPVLSGHWLALRHIYPRMLLEELNTPEVSKGEGKLDSKITEV